MISNRALGRFIHRDPIGYADGMNLYEYVQSSPVGYVDPIGTTVSHFLGQIASVIKGTRVWETKDSVRHQATLLTEQLVTDKAWAKGIATFVAESLDILSNLVAVTGAPKAVKLLIEGADWLNAAADDPNRLFDKAAGWALGKAMTKAYRNTIAGILKKRHAPLIKAMKKVTETEAKLRQIIESKVKSPGEKLFAKGVSKVKSAAIKQAKKLHKEALKALAGM